jgi:sulfopyruvate decarboxylase subunit beta
VSFRCRDAVQQLLEAFGEEACYICANGYISREVFTLRDVPGNFYMLGSMGLGGSIALGCALSQPERKIVVLDGDGNLLMGLGGLTLVGAKQPSNLYHVCLDNGVYASTGNQPTVAPHVSLEGIAAAAGYPTSLEVTSAEALAQALPTFVSAPAPAFLRVRISPEDHPRDFARVNHTPEEIHERFATALQGGQ